MNITFVSGNLSRQSGGVFEIELGLAQRLQKAGVNVAVVGYADSDWPEDAQRWAPLKATALPIRFPRFIKYAPGYQRALVSGKTDIYHAHLMWLYSTVAMRRVVKKASAPYLYSIHGFINEWTWKRSAWKKRIAWLFYEKNSLRQASCLHVNSWKEYRQLRVFGLKNPIAIIPNGVDAPKVAKNVSAPWMSIPQFQDKKTLLFLSRIHPKKGMEPLLQAWKKNRKEAQKAGWNLVIAGWGEDGYVQKLKKWTQENNLNKSVLFVGPQFNARKAACLYQAKAFILPSFSEGQPMAALEAMACGLPCLLTPACNLPESFSRQAAWTIRPTTTGIGEGLRQLFMVTESQLSEKRRQALQLVSEKYSWESTARQMKTVYQWMLDDQETPNTLIFD